MDVDSRLAAVWQSITWSNKYESSTPKSTDYGAAKYCWYASETGRAGQVLASLPEVEVREVSCEVVPKEWLGYNRLLETRREEVIRSVHLASYLAGSAIVVCEKVKVLSVSSVSLPQNKSKRA